MQNLYGSGKKLSKLKIQIQSQKKNIIKGIRNLFKLKQKIKQLKTR